MGKSKHHASTMGPFSTGGSCGAAKSKTCKLYMVRFCCRALLNNIKVGGYMAGPDRIDRTYHLEQDTEVKLGVEHRNPSVWFSQTTGEAEGARSTCKGALQEKKQQALQRHHRRSDMFG